MGDQEYSALAFDWSTVSSPASGLSSVVTEVRARSVWPSEEGAQEEKGKQLRDPPAASPPALLQFWMACPAGLSHPACHLGAPLGSVEGVRVGSTLRSCFAVASGLLSWACTSGSNKLKLAHDGEGRAKPQTEPWK